MTHDEWRARAVTSLLEKWWNGKEAEVTPEQIVAAIRQSDDAAGFVLVPRDDLRFIRKVLTGDAPSQSDCVAVFQCIERALNNGSLNGDGEPTATGAADAE